MLRRVVWVADSGRLGVGGVDFDARKLLVDWSWDSICYLV